jgi:8-oxo-dGTP diphosphatase
MFEPPRGPHVTVDAIIELPGDRVVLVERGFPPLGWAWPGGFVDYGEPAEDACVREAKEETALDVEIADLLGVYSDPSRDPRLHTLSVVYVARATGEPKGGDDAKAAHAVPVAELLGRSLVFDHGLIARDYLRFRETGERPAPNR